MAKSTTCLTPVKRVRLELGLKQCDVAQRAGISAARLCDIEYGKIPHQHEADEIARVLGTEAGKLWAAESQK
jgi:transcriptional regulator with XRE-family HTH domain